MPKPLNQPYLIASLALLILLIGNVFFAYDDHGTSWDEYFHYNYGDEKLNYYRDLIAGKDTSRYFESPNVNMYPGFFDINLAIFRMLTDMSAKDSAHLLTALSGLVGIVGAWCLGYQLGGHRAAFLGAFFLALMPRFYGHMWFNLKDVPFAVAYLWALYFTVQAIRDLPRIKVWSMLAAAVATGIAMGVRAAGLLLIFYLAVAFGLDLLRTLKIDRKSFFRSVGRYALTGILCYCVAVLALLPWWPYAHHNPLVVPIKVVLGLHEFPFTAPVLFFGEFIKPQELPLSYLPVWLGITTPIPILLLWAIAVVLSILSFIRIAKSETQLKSNAWIQYFVVGFAFFFPIVYVLISRPDLYDGLRQMLFLLPVGAVLAALTLESLLKMLKKARQQAILLLVSIASMLLLVLPSYFSLHPYQYIYFNELIGGLQGAFERFDTDYYGISYREAVEILQAEELSEEDGEPILVSCSGAPWFIKEYLDDNHRFSLEIKQSDFYISYLRWRDHLKVNGLIHGFVEREGVPLTLIIKVDPGEGGTVE